MLVAAAMPTVQTSIDMHVTVCVVSVEVESRVWGLGVGGNLINNSSMLAQEILLMTPTIPWQQTFHLLINIIR